MRYLKHWHNVRYEASKKRETLAIWFVWRLPKRVVYWSAIRLAAHATTGPHGDQEVPALLFMDALERWDTA